MNISILLEIEGWKSLELLGWIIWGNIRPHALESHPGHGGQAFRIYRKEFVTQISTYVAQRVGKDCRLFKF